MRIDLIRANKLHHKNFSKTSVYFHPIVFHKYTCTALSVKLLDNVRKKYALLAVLPLALCN